MSFLPQNYEPPKSSYNYMKLQEGENKIRILTAPIMGWEDWIEKKPIRYRQDEKPAKSHDPKKPVRHFWAMVVWNYIEEKIQILYITQATVRNGIHSLCRDKDWGEPFYYDIKIVKTGEGTDTEYVVTPLPHKPVDPTIKIAFFENRCCLDSLFDGGDPFSSDHSSYTEGVFDDSTHVSNIVSHDTAKEIKKISAAQVQELETIFIDCGENALASTLKTLRLQNVKDVPIAIFNAFKNKGLLLREQVQLKALESSDVPF